MSKILKSLDPRVDLSKQVNYVIEDGASLVSYDVSNSSNTGGTLTFSNADPPGVGVIIDKKIIVGVTFKLTFTRTSAPLNEPVIGFEPLPGFAYPTDRIRALGTDAPRFLPLAQVTSSMKVTINGSSPNGLLYEWIDPLMRYNGHRDYNESQLSLAPSTQDEYQDYGDYLLHGSSRNVLGDYGESSYQTNRGGFPNIWIAQNDLGTGVPGNVTTAVVYMTTYEPILVSPCDFGMSNQRGFIGVENFRVDLTLFGDLERVWSHNGNAAKGGWPLTSINVEVAPTGDTITYTNGITTTLPALYFTYLTPKVLDPIPKFNAYPYYPSEVQVFDSVRTLTAGSSTIYKTNSFKLNSIPKYLYLYARRSNDTRTFEDTDTYAFINKLSITFANNSSLLNSANPIQLYEMSAKNGCNLSWAQWSKYTGSVVCIDFSQDLGLQEGLFVGLRDPNAQLSVEMTFTNLSEATVNYSVYAVPIYVGIMDLSNGQSRLEQGVVTLQDYLNSTDIQSIEHTDAHNFYGGNFLTKVRDLSRRAIPKLKKYGKEVAKALPEVTKVVAPVIAPRAAPILQEGADVIARLVGAGMNEQDAYDYVNGGGLGGGLGGARRPPRRQSTRQPTRRGGAALNNYNMRRALGM